MSKENKYSISALAERSARCKAAMDMENREYFNSIVAWIRSCCDRLRAVDPDISAALALTKNMVGMGLAPAMNTEELAYGEIPQDSFAKSVCMTCRYKVTLHLKGFELDCYGGAGATRLFCHYRAHNGNPSVFFGDLPHNPDAYDVEEYARHLFADDIIIRKSRDRMNAYMAEVDDLIDNGLPAFIQRLCEFADRKLDNN